MAQRAWIMWTEIDIKWEMNVCFTSNKLSESLQEDKATMIVCILWKMWKKHGSEQRQKEKERYEGSFAFNFLPFLLTRPDFPFSRINSPYWVFSYSARARKTSIKWHRHGGGPFLRTDVNLWMCASMQFFAIFSGPFAGKATALFFEMTYHLLVLRATRKIARKPTKTFYKNRLSKVYFYFYQFDVEGS